MSYSQLPPFLGRMLWKEYRAQRGLWLVVGGVMLIAQIMTRLVLTDVDLISVDIWFMAGLGPLLFAVGAVAILFAGERESRTSEWLLQLSAPPGWLLAVKWGSVILASQCLVLVLTISAMLLTGAQASMVTLISTWVLGSGVLLWGSLGSLLTRRVVTSIPTMVFCWIALMLVPVLTMGRLVSAPAPYFGIFVVVQLSIILAVGLVDVWLGWRWCQGKYVDGQAIEQLAVGVLSRISRRSAPCEWGLQTDLVSGWQRAWQRLIWQERNRESYHGMLLGAGTLATSLLTAAGFQTESLCLIAAVPLLLGVLAFRSEGEGQPLRFLANRGVSPLAVWLAKQYVWFPRVFAIPAVMILAALVTESLTSRGGSIDLWMRPAEAVWTTGLMELATAKTIVDRGLVFDLLWFALIGFAAGQLSAMLFRKTAMALVCGGLLNVLFVAWLGTMVTVGVPRYWSAGGLVAWMMSVAICYSTFWLTERQSAAMLRRLALIVLPPLVLIGTVGGWRAVEVAGFGPRSPLLFAIVCPGEFARLESQAALERRQSTVDSVQADIAQQLRPEAPDVDELLQRSWGGFNTVREFILSGALARVEEPFAPDIVVPARERFWAENEQRLADILKFTQQDFSRLPRWQEPATSNHQRMAPLQILLAEAARLRTEEGRLEEAFQYYHASLRLAKFWGTERGWQAWWEAKSDQDWVLQNLIGWANHPGQTMTLLQEAKRKLAVELRSFPTIHETLISEYLQNRLQLDRSIVHGMSRRMDSEGVLGYWQQSLADGFRFLPWEHVRAHRMLEQVLLHQVQAERRVRGWLNQPSVDVKRSIDEMMAQPEWLEEDQLWQTTPLLPDHNEFRSRLYAMIERETLVRESLLALDLLMWKLKHSQWPDNLGDLLESADAERLPALTLADPWGGDLFYYRGNRDDDVERGPHTLLASVGLNGLHFIYADDPKLGHRTVPGGATIAARNWQGQLFDSRDDDRLQLEVVDGKLSLLLPYAKKISR